MRILAFDTSTEACSVALWQNGHTDCLFEVAPQQHTHILLPMIQRLLNKHAVSIQSLSSVAFAQGPGSFTGLRIASGVAQGFSLAQQIPVIAVSTLASLALKAKNTATDDIIYFVSALDARMGEIYLALYTCIHNRLIPVLADCLVSPSQAIILLKKHLKGQPWVGSGSGIYLIQNQIQPTAEQLYPDAYPSAHEVVLLAVDAYIRGEFSVANKILPNYLRNEIVAV